MTDPFEHHDAAYVLGALDESDRRAFEVHLGTCPDCRDRVAQARGTALLLAELPEEAYAQPEPMPDTLLPGLLRKAGRERARRRWFTAGIGAVAAACLAALIIVAWPSGGPTTARPAQLAFAPLGASPITASAALVNKAWGTEIDLKCEYAQPISGKLPYELIVVDKQHASHSAGNWTLAPGMETITFTGGTAVPRSDISSVQIATPSGRPILQLTL